MEPGQRSRAHVPHPPRSYEPLVVRDAVGCLDAGATILHLHARRGPARASPPPDTKVRLAERVAELAELAGRRLATASEVRERLGLA